MPSAGDAGRWICFDVGETLVDETRVWSVWADVLGVPRFTLMAAIGAAIASRQDFREAFTIVGRPDWRELSPVVGEKYGAFLLEDLYSDALPTLTELSDRGYRLAIIANQPAQRTAELRTLGAIVDVIAMSEEMGTHKPDPQFFKRALELMGSPNPSDVTYVGDRLDNDVGPAHAAGMRTVWIRRGPWGLIQKGPPPSGAVVVETLTEVVERLDDIWAPAATAA